MEINSHTSFLKTFLTYQLIKKTHCYVNIIKKAYYNKNFIYTKIKTVIFLVK